MYILYILYTLYAYKIDFTIEIDYTNILENLNKIGSGQTGISIKYKNNYIVLKK